MRTTIINAQIILPDKIIDGFLTVEGGKIAHFVAGQPPEGYAPGALIDAGGRYLSPGFFDIHTHGAGGSDFMDGTPEAATTAAKTHLEHGTTSLLATSVAASQEATEACIDSFLAAKDAVPNLIGLHMEGPYLNAEYKGAIDERYIVSPSLTQCRELAERAEGFIKRWTIAPELPGALEMGDWLVSQGILPSIGHSSAEYSLVKEAYQHGYTHVTHLYSAMSTIVRRSGFRYPGVLESAFIIDDMTVELIADGCHVPIELLQMVHKFKGTQTVALVCDSMRCAGTDAETSVLGSLSAGLPVVIEDGVAKLPDRSAFAGSIATDDRLVRVMHKGAGIPLTDCIQMMCLTPARIIKMDDRKGSVATGKDADLILFDDEIHVDWVMADGHVVHGAL